MKTSLLLLLLLFKLSLAYSQDKLEREYRIKESGVPAKALNYVESIFKNVGMKWYGEENLNGKAIEAKGRLQGDLYSVKFSVDGNLQDVERVMDFNSIPEDVRNTIAKNLKSRFSKFKLQKTQIQWVGNMNDLAALVKEESVTGTYTTNYEITLRGTKDGRTDYYEILSDNKGELIRESKIVQRSNQNLIY